MPPASMSGKICIVTGANSGIGKETALGLAQMGARVVMVCRNAEKGKAALEEIWREAGSSQGRTADRGHVVAGIHSSSRGGNPAKVHPPRRLGQQCRRRA